MMDNQRVGLKLSQDVMARVRIFMARNGYNLRSQSEAVEELLKRTLDKEGY